MNRALSLTLLLLAAPLTAGAGTMNYAYSVSGDAQARPVQAFDDGRQLYVQLRNPADPPAPIGPAGPMAYQMRGPYLVLPLLSSVTLQYGPYQARVLASGAAETGGGVVSVNRPIEVVDVPPTLQMTAASPMAVRMPQAVSAPLEAAVTGEIDVTGPSGTSHAAIAAAPAATASMASATRSLTFTQASQSAAFNGLRSHRLVLHADGSSAGAQAALAARATCVSAGARCEIDFKGAAPGTILIVEKNG